MPYFGHLLLLGCMTKIRFVRYLKPHIYSISSTDRIRGYGPHDESSNLSWSTNLILNTMNYSEYNIHIGTETFI